MSGPSRFVRQFALTQGRARSIGQDFAIETLVYALAVDTDAPASETRERLAPEQMDILRLATRPVSIAEISAHLHIYLGVARVLVSDMVFHGLVAVTAPETTGVQPDLVTLERLLNDLQTL